MSNNKISVKGSPELYASSRKRGSAGPHLQDSRIRGNDRWLGFTNVFAAIALFFFLTSGIPLIQLGMLSDFGESKKQYLRIASLSLFVLGLMLIFLRWRKPLFFERLWIVRGSLAVLQAPLKPVIFVLWILYTAALISAGWFRHAALETRAFDLGVFAQALWNTTQGDFLYSSLKGGICLLGDHFSPLLVLLAPVYKIWPDPRILLVLQPLISALCLFPLAKLARSRFEGNRPALIFSLIYFFYMPTRAALHEDFHPEVLAEPLMFWAFIWLEEKRRFLFSFALLLILSAKENMAGITFILGTYAFFFKRERLLGLFWMLASPLYLAACVKMIIPVLSGQTYLYGGFYDSVLQGGGAEVWNLLKDTERWGYAVKVFLPVLFLSWLDLPSLILTLPVLTQNLLSDNGVVRSFNYHYTTGLTPFVFISAVLGLKRLQIFLQSQLQYFKIILAGLLLTGLLRSGAPEYFYVWQSASRVDGRTQMIRSEMKRLPAEAILVTHNNLAPQTVNRRSLYLFDYNPTPTKEEIALKYGADYLVMDVQHWEPGTAPFEVEKAALLRAGYQVQFEKDGFLILKKQDLYERT